MTCIIYMRFIFQPHDGENKLYCELSNLSICFKALGYWFCSKKEAIIAEVKVVWIDNAYNACDTQKTHTKPRHRMRNSDNACKTPQFRMRCLSFVFVVWVSFAFSTFRMRCRSFVYVVRVSYALSEFRMRCQRFACAVWVSYAFSEFRMYSLGFNWCIYKMS
jgi:hypothetical protein